MDRMRDEEVLKRVNEEAYLIRTITQRKKKCIEHVMRGDGLLNEVLEGKIEEKRRTGDPREE